MTAEAEDLGIPSWYYITLHYICEILEIYDGEGNGTLLQYSCLENPMDGGAW